jgi:hypothetical protein
MHGRSTLTSMRVGSQVSSLNFYANNNGVLIGDLTSEGHENDQLLSLHEVANAACGDDTVHMVYTSYAYKDCNPVWDTWHSKDEFGEPSRLFGNDLSKQHVYVQPQVVSFTMPAYVNVQATAIFTAASCTNFST